MKTKAINGRKNIQYCEIYSWILSHPRYLFPPHTYGGIIDLERCCYATEKIFLLKLIWMDYNYFPYPRYPLLPRWLSDRPEFSDCRLRWMGTISIRFHDVSTVTDQWELWMKLLICKIQRPSTEKCHEYFLWNYFQVNTTGHHDW